MAHKNSGHHERASYAHLNPSFSRNSRTLRLGRQSAYIWLMMLSVFILSAFFETRAGQQTAAVPHPSWAKHLSPEICAQYLAGAPGAPGAPAGPRYTTRGLGQNPVPATLPNFGGAPRIGFEIAPQLPAIPNLPPRGVAGWVDVDPLTGGVLINGQSANAPAGPSEQEIIAACHSLFSDK